MKVSTVFAVFRARWFSILATALVGGLLASAVTLGSGRVYEASSEVFITQNGGASSAELIQGSSYVMDRMDSYAQTMGSDLVLQPVIDDMGLDTTVAELAANISTSVVEDTVVIVITARSDDSAEAVELANTVAARFQDVSTSLDPPRADGSSVVEATVIQSAEQPERPVTPRPFLNLFLGLMAGGLAAMAYVLVRQVADRRVRTESEVQALLEAPVLARVPIDDVTTGFGHLFDSAVCAESVRQLRTSLQFLALPPGGRSYVITSPRRDDGRTAIALGLAAAQADAGQRVCYVEADLRHPSAAQHLGLVGALGLSDVLVGAADLDAVTVRLRHRFDVVLAGSAPPNPADLLAREATPRIVHQLEGAYDIVIFDSPPLMPATEGAILSRLCTGTLLVVRVDRRAATRREISHSADALAGSGARLLGVILNHCWSNTHQRVQREALNQGSATPISTTPAEAPSTHHGAHSVQV